MVLLSVSRAQDSLFWSGYVVIKALVGTQEQKALDYDVDF